MNIAQYWKQEVAFGKVKLSINYAVKLRKHREKVTKLNIINLIKRIKKDLD